MSSESHNLVPLLKHPLLRGSPRKSARLGPARGASTLPHEGVPQHPCRSKEMTCQFVQWAALVSLLPPSGGVHMAGSVRGVGSRLPPLLPHLS